MDATAENMIECDFLKCTSNMRPLNLKTHGLAAASGWTIVEHDDGTHEDFCPDHTPS